MTDAKVGEAFIELRYQFDKLSADLKTAQAQVNKQIDGVARGVGQRLKAGLGGAFSKIGGSLSSVQGQIAGIGASIGATNVFGGIIRTAGDFEAAIQQVAAVSGATGDELASLAAEARRLGAATKFSAQEAADAQGFLAQAGFSTDQILQSLEGTLKLASAGNVGLAESADIVSNVLSGFGKSAEETVKVSNILAGTFTQSNTNLQQLGQAFSEVAPVVSNSATSIEQASAALGVLGDNGIQAGRAGTGLKNVILSLANPTGPAAEAIESLGLKLAEVQSSTNNLPEILERFADTSISAGEAAAIFGREAAPAALALIGNRKRVEELTASLEAQETQVDKVAAIQNQGLNASLKSLSSAFSELQLALADSGILEGFTSLVKGLTDIVRSVSEANPSILKFTAIAATIAGVLAPAATAFALFGGPILAATAAIGGLVGAAVAFGPDIIRAIEPAIETVKAAFAGLTDFVNETIDTLASLPDRVTSSIGDLGSSVKESITGGLDSALASVNGFVDAADRKFFELYDAVVGNSYIPDMVDGISEQIQRLGPEMVEPIRVATGQADGAFKQLQTSVSGAASSFGDGFVQAAENFSLVNESAKLGQQAFSGLGDAFVNSASEGTKAFKDFAKSLLQDIAKVIIQASIARAVLAAFGGASSVGVPTGASNFVPPGFRNGGRFRVTGNGGIDSQLVQFMATPGETVSVSKSSEGFGGGGSGDLVVNVIDNRQNGGEIKQRRSTGPGGQQVLDLTILDSVARGAAQGGLDAALGNRFGLKPVGAR